MPAPEQQQSAPPIARPKPWDARLAAWLVRPWLHSPRVMPNHFTALRLAVGLAGAWCFASGRWPNAGALLIVLSNFLDHTDGELARLGNKGSRFGHYFDLASDAIVTIGLFAGIGIGLSHGPLGNWAAILGLVAGLAVAAIFHMRNQIENQHGKSATSQAQFAGFEAEDVLYLLPLVSFFDLLPWFLYAAAVGAPAAALLVFSQYRELMHANGDVA